MNGRRLLSVLPALMAGVVGGAVEPPPIQCVPVSCPQCGLSGVANVSRGPVATPRGFVPSVVTQWVEPPRGWASSIMVDNGGKPTTMAFRCRRCVTGEPNYGREAFLDHVAFGEVKREGRLERAGERATTCLECDAIVARGAYATERELEAHRATCAPRGASGAGSVEP